ncbi:hypothetical protein BKA70DRAFT_1222625 [Coprinopsis sp. MPI-PUGE-AT-0042]|nr:hypothetical protein BKA70DRAFT_1222625 [Coprinopsis sp. MPI-PUGE-AT-0042]
MASRARRLFGLKRGRQLARCNIGPPSCLSRPRNPTLAPPISQHYLPLVTYSCSLAKPHLTLSLGPSGTILELRIGLALGFLLVNIRVAGVGGRDSINWCHSSHLPPCKRVCSRLPASPVPTSATPLFDRLAAGTESPRRKGEVFQLLKPSLASTRAHPWTLTTVDAAERPATHPLFTDPVDRRVAFFSAAVCCSQGQQRCWFRSLAAQQERELLGPIASGPSSTLIPFPTLPGLLQRTPDADAQLRQAPPPSSPQYLRIAIPPVPKSKLSPSKYDKSLYDAAKARKRQRNIDHDQNRKARAEWHGFKSPEDYERFHLLRRPAGCEVPSRNTWVLEMPEAFEEAAGYLNTQPLADSRRHNGGRPTPVQMDYSLLTIVIPEDLNIVLHNADSKSSEVFASRNAVAAAYMWRHVKLMHPQCVGDDIENWHKEHDLPRLDGTWPAAGAQDPWGQSFILRHVWPISIKDAEFGPGCLVMSKITQGCTGQFTVRPNPTNGPALGRPYGLAPIPGATISIYLTLATSIAWKPTHYHTSSMGSWNLKASFGRHTDRRTPPCGQQGICFVTSNRIATVYKQYKGPP